MMHSAAVERKDILALVVERMRREGVTQRTLAPILGITQGHLSKLLRREVAPRARLEGKLKAWAHSSAAADELSGLPPEFLVALRELLHHSPTMMHFVAEMMRLLVETRDRPADTRRCASRTPRRRA